VHVEARPPRSSREIEIDTRSIPVADVRPRADLPERTRSGRRWGPVIALVLAVAVAVVGLITILPTSPEGGTPVASTPPSATATSSGSVGPPFPPPTTTASPTPTASPSATGTGVVPTPPEEAFSLSFGGIALVALAALALVALLIGLVTLRRRARWRGHHGHPAERESPAEAPGAGSAANPRASLGTPDVLILTEAATEGDPRLHERVKGGGDAVFANLQLACSFHPTDDWVFRSARLRVVLAREDGRAAPAPIAYSLLPLSDRDGTAREQSVEIGADMKFVSLRGGEKTTMAGHEFVRGYGLQESVSYWEFTATPNRPLEGSFLLWLIARAPRDSDLVVHSDLDVWVAPRRFWRHSGSASVAGTGEVTLLLGLTHGPPYSARLIEPSTGSQHQPWLVDVR
jgi:hypothetical protein